MTINKRAVRSIKNNIAFYIICIILTLLTSMLIVAAVSTGHTLTNVVADFVDEYKAEDAEFVTYHPISDADIENLEQDYDIILAYSRYKDITTKNEEYGDSVIRIFPMPEKLNLCEVRDGKRPESGEAMLTQNFADCHDIKVGDMVKLGDVSYKISAFATKSDYIYMLQELSGYRDNEKFALMIVGEADYEKIDAEEIGYYSIRYNKDNEKEVRKKLNNDYVIASYLAAATNTRISMPVNEGEAVTNMAMLFAPAMFIIVIALIVMVLGRRIKNEQYLLGTFFALGFSKKQIIRHYMRFGLLPGIAGSVLGVLCAIPFTKFLSYFFIEFDYEKLTYTNSYDVVAIVIALVIPSVLYCLAIAWQTVRLLKKSPVELIRNTGKDSRTIGVMKNSPVKTATKLRVRSVIGHPGRSMVTVIGVCIAAFCILTGLIMKDSLDDLMDDGLTSSVKYEYLYRLNYLGEGEPEQGEALFQNYYEVEGSTVQLSAQGIDENSDYFPDKTEDGKSLAMDKYYLTSAAAETYGVKAGDEFSFYNIADLKEHKVTISGVVTDNTHCYLYSARDNITELAGVGKGAYNYIVSDKKLELPKDEIASETTMTVAADTMNDLMGPMDAIIIGIEIFGIVLGVFILYLIINMIAAENRTGISVMKVLGLSKREIAGRVLNVNHVLVCIGFVLSIPLAYGFVKIGYADTIENYGMLLAPVITVKSLIIGFLLTWITYEISLFLQRRKISGIDMVEALKENNRNE